MLDTWQDSFLLCLQPGREQEPFSVALMVMKTHTWTTTSSCFRKPFPALQVINKRLYGSDLRKRRERFSYICSGFLLKDYSYSFQKKLEYFFSERKLIITATSGFIKNIRTLIFHIWLRSEKRNKSC